VATIDTALVTTAVELAGHRVVRNVGVARGLVVRSRSIVGNFGAMLRLFSAGTSLSILNSANALARSAIQLMTVHSSKMGANAIICVRYDANEVAAGITEVLAYGTAVAVE